MYLLRPPSNFISRKLQFIRMPNEMLVPFPIQP